MLEKCNFSFYKNIVKDTKTMLLLQFCALRAALGVFHCCMMLFIFVAVCVFVLCLVSSREVFDANT